MRERECLTPASSLSKGLEWLELGQSEARSLEHHLSLPNKCRNSSTWTILHCVPRHVNRELDWAAITQNGAYLVVGAIGHSLPAMQ